MLESQELSLSSLFWEAAQEATEKAWAQTVAKYVLDKEVGYLLTVDRAAKNKVTTWKHAL